MSLILISKKSQKSHVWFQLPGSLKNRECLKIWTTFLAVL